MYAIKAICTIQGSSLFGETVTLWRGHTLRNAYRWLDRLQTEHKANYEAFSIVDEGRD